MRDFALMEAKVAKLPKWAQDLIASRNRKIDQLHEMIDAFDDPRGGAITVGDDLNREAAVGFTAHAVVRVKLENGTEISIHHEQTGVKVYSSRRLVVVPYSANCISLESKL